MATVQRGTPIKRLELEFIPSNVTGFDHIVKINIIRTPGMTGEIEFIYVRKYLIDKEDKTLFDEAEYYLNYMSNSVYMSESIFMGGIDLKTFAKDHASLYIRSIRLADFRYLLDYMIDQDDVLMYNINYKYKGVEFNTPVVTSFKPVDVKALGGLQERPCITLRNLRHRGPNESIKYTNMTKELFCDMRRLEEFSESVNADVDTVTEEMDSNFISLYNIMDSVKYYNQNILSEE